MKLDMDLIRDLLIWCEERLPDENRSYVTDDIEIPNHTPFEIVFHIKLLVDNGYLEARNISTSRKVSFRLSCLTLHGYDFLEGIRNISAWNEIKETATKIGTKVFVSAIPIILNAIGKQAGLIP